MSLDPSQRIGMDAERQLRLLEHRHAMALLFIDSKGLRIEYDTHMARLGLASEFLTGTFRREEAELFDGTEEQAR